MVGEEDRGVWQYARTAIGKGGDGTNFFVGLRNALIPSLILWALIILFFRWLIG